MTQRRDLKTKGYDPDKETGDGSFIGEGQHKVVWRQNDFAVINATDDQRDIDEGSTKEEIEKSNLKIKNEYNFTVYLHEKVSTIVGIPKVYRYKEEDYFGDTKFRYAKELCENVVINDDLFHEMIDLSDRLLDAGWVYVDIKPDNLGLLDGKLCIVDTDHRSFYRIPKELVDDFRSWNYLIILIYAYNHLKKEVTRPTLFNFINQHKINMGLLQRLTTNHTGMDRQHEINQKIIAMLSKKIIDHGNKEFMGYEKYIHLDYIFLPHVVFEGYGKKGRISPVKTFQNMIKSSTLFSKAGTKPIPTLEPTPAPQGQRERRASAPQRTNKKMPSPSQVRPAATRTIKKNNAQAGAPKGKLAVRTLNPQAGAPKVGVAVRPPVPRNQSSTSKNRKNGNKSQSSSVARPRPSSAAVRAGPSSAPRPRIRSAAQA